ncbi:helix-turn-helix domain-containing protein [Lysinibacillus sp. M3]|uniref:Helix-turn-helix domain-containing protein n=1 Tax=Lysinibacillus zambalensis TaxID=3160866 RepID=A0ABV1MVJ2_9BACI
MTIITLQHTQDTYESLQLFRSKEEMNKAVKAHKRLNKEQLTKSTYAVLDFISQWSCKYVGVSYLCQKRIAESLEISYKTVQRAISKLVELNVVKKFKTKRATGDKRQSSNIIVIQPAKENVQPKCPPEDTLINTQNINKTNDTEKEGLSLKEADKESLIKKGLVKKLPETLQRVLAPFFDADEIYKLAGTIYKAKSKIDKAIQIEDYSNEYYQCILSVINAYKRGKADSLHGLLFHAIKATTKTIWLKQRATGGIWSSFLT